MNHSMAVGAEHGKVTLRIEWYRAIVWKLSEWCEMVRFDVADANVAVSVLQRAIAGLTSEPVDALGVFGQLPVALNASMQPEPAAVLHALPWRRDFIRTMPS